MGLNLNEMMKRIIKYLIEGTFVAIAAYVIPSRGKLPIEEVLMIGLMAACTFAILDVFVPAIGQSTRQGVGMGIGLNVGNFPGGSLAG